MLRSLVGSEMCIRDRPRHIQCVISLELNGYGYVHTNIYMTIMMLTYFPRKHVYIPAFEGIILKTENYRRPIVMQRSFGRYNFQFQRSRVTTQSRNFVGFCESSNGSLNASVCTNAIFFHLGITKSAAKVIAPLRIGQSPMHVTHLVSPASPVRKPTGDRAWWISPQAKRSPSCFLSSY